MANFDLTPMMRGFRLGYGISVLGTVTYLAATGHQVESLQEELAVTAFALVNLAVAALLYRFAK